VRIDQLLAGKGRLVVTIDPGATIWQALARLSEFQVGALVVSADGARPEGMLSERDIVRQLHARGAAVLDGSVADVMVGPVLSAGPDDEVDSIMAVMTEHRIRHVPVVADGELGGIISIGDVVKSRIQELEKDRNELMEYITAR
jgi:CBS domain-containing protein